MKTELSFFLYSIRLTSELAEAKKSEDADQSVEIKENIDASLEAKCSPGKADEKPKEDIHPAQEEEASRYDN
jgi:hypothetical protein